VGPDKASKGRNRKRRGKKLMRMAGKERVKLAESQQRRTKD